MENPRLLAQRLEEEAVAPSGPGERFRGYGVMGLPFTSGHVLAFRRMAASSIGPPYTSLWHRTPSGEWTFYVDAPPVWSCPRYFGSAVSRVVEGEIRIGWEGPMSFSVLVPDARLQWGVRLTADRPTRIYSAVGRLLPEWFWRREWALSALGRIGGRLMGLERLALSGHVPNGQRFAVAPRLIWRVEASAAVLDGEEMGRLGPLEDQARLGDFWIPNGGVFAFGYARFERFDPGLHERAVPETANHEARPAPVHQD